MFNKYRKNHKVIVCGSGEIDGKIYENVLAVIIERDAYFKDYLVKFADGTQDWILEQNLKKPYEEEGVK